MARARVEAISGTYDHIIHFDLQASAATVRLPSTTRIIDARGSETVGQSLS